ncbi:MAG TPA: PH domain-containing protein [Tessaracoccus flavescens]|uniref:PH domain-containing protein n=1 Tax=Tessaracoccus flavescens TaxID=399497 RepID=A0A921EPR4_9ACTN|nr:PH domain-containing protein [Tessaracoccus flavescens]
MNELFAPPGVEWQRLSPNYLKLKLLMIPLVWIVFFGALAALAFWLFPSWVGWTVIGVGVVWLAWRIWRAPRVFRSWGYAERDEDVYLTHGIFFKNLTCVPYGRMQLVQVNSGPLQRAFGLASVQMVTSSTSGSIDIPGLTAADAAALRDRLIEHGENQQAGI